MHRARSRPIAPALLALAGALPSCTLYFDEPPPGPPAVDAGYPWLPDASPPPPPPPPDRLDGVAGQIEVPPSLRGQDALVDVVWLYDDEPMRHEVFAVGADTAVFDVEGRSANMVSATMYAGPSQIAASAVFQARCPGDTYAPARDSILEVPLAYPTIQQAIDAATSRDIVYVHPGTYYEHLRLRPGVHLVGAGAHRTVIDGEGLGENLIDFTGAAGSVVRGFTLRNVGPRADNCDSATDALSCSGDWFAGAVYGDGHDAVTYGPGCDSSVVLLHNIIEAADTGVLLYYYATAVVRNNVFIDSGNGVLSSLLHERALVMGNTFAGAAYRIVGVRAAGLHASNNVLASAPVAVESDYDDRDYELSCNLHWAVEKPGVLPIGEDDNIEMDPGFRDVAARDYRLGDEVLYGQFGCYTPREEEWFPPDPGAYGGPLGPWYLQEITLDDVLRVVD